MIKVDQYQLIRELYAVKGLSQREIARTLGISRNTVKKYCEGENLPFEKSTRKRQPTVITPEVEKFIQECFEQDNEDKAPKQKHTAKRIYDRLVEELGFEGGESTIRHYVKALKDKPLEAFVPLEFDPGEAIQMDWGQAVIYLKGVRTTIRLFYARLCYSAMPFVIGFPHERIEALVEGHIETFEFFGGVGQRSIYDNMRTIVNDGWGKHVRLFSPLIDLEKTLSSAIIQIRGKPHDKKRLYTRIQRTDIKGMPRGRECCCCRQTA